MAAIPNPMRKLKKAASHGFSMYFQ